MKSVLILGGGVSGLSAAMELMNDFDVTIVEKRSIVGGKARTWTDARYGVFREHSFRVFHKTYYNLFDAMRRVPTASGRTVYDNLEDYMDRKRLFESYPETWKMYRRESKELTRQDVLDNARDILTLARLLASSEARLKDSLCHTPFEEFFKERADGSRGLVFEVLRNMSQVEYSADRLNPDLKVMLNFIEKHFLHGPPGTGWKALTGPTSDTFIEPFRRFLTKNGVRFRTDTEVVAIDFDADRARIDGAWLKSGAGGTPERARADYYVSAMPSDCLLPLATKDLLLAAPSIAKLSRLRRVWNNGAIIYTSKKQELRGAYYMWHPWRVAVTAYSRRWSGDYDMSKYGVGDTKGTIADILSYVICDWESPGVYLKKPARDCSADEIYEELCFMGKTDETIIANFDVSDHVYPSDGDGGSARCLVDAALIYDEAGARIVKNEDTLVHVPAGGYYDLLPAETAIGNFVLASTHCFNAFGCGDSMEGANETGRRAANAVIMRSGVGRVSPVLEGRTESPVIKLLGVARFADRFVYALTNGA